MNCNDDFSKRVLLHGDSLPWEASPMPGVDRRRLDRVVGDHDRVTTIVRYAPNSRFSAHAHPGGEEFIVLDGVFEDEYGDWPPGSYVRNPPTSKHTPGSKSGCKIFVKLWQFDPDDRTFVHANRHKLGAVPDQNRPGAHVSPLFEDAVENVRFERWEPSAVISVDAAGGAELLVVEGDLTESGDHLRPLSWLRMPRGSILTGTAGQDGAVVWIKTGHLPAT